jgi:cystathionine gamma-synthase
MLFPSAKVAEQCRSFMISQGATHPLRIAQCVLEHASDLDAEPIKLHVVLFHSDHSHIAKAFWQHTGLGISSRLAEAALKRMGEDCQWSPPPSAGLVKPSSRYVVKKDSHVLNGAVEVIESTAWIEERYGRNLPLSSADNAKRVLRRRIAGVLVQDRSSIDDPDVQQLLAADAGQQELAESVRSSFCPLVCQQSGQPTRRRSPCGLKLKPSVLGEHSC